MFQFFSGTKSADGGKKETFRILPKAGVPAPGAPVQTGDAYKSLPIDIPASFLSATDLPPDSTPVKVRKVDFKSTPLPEYDGRYAVIIDNVLSPSECATLIRLAEESVPLRPAGNPPTTTDDDLGPDIVANLDAATAANVDNQAVATPSDPWTPALVNIGAGWEVHQPDYRNSDRIILDSSVLTSRLWDRIAALCPSISDELRSVDGGSRVIVGARKAFANQTWEFVCLNERMRFLRYGAGQFFRPHCDGAYEVPWEQLPEPKDGGEKRRRRTLFTLHLYLNDSVEGLTEEGRGEEGERTKKLVGGSTPFLSNDETRRVDVHPRAGRVLIFQHSGLLHSGDDVKEGVKFTMRSDILYELQPKEDTE